MEQNYEKKHLVLKIVAIESRTTNSHNPEQDTCYCQSTCYKRHLRFNISLREIFFKSNSTEWWKMWWKCSDANFTRIWDPLTCWLSKGVVKECFLESNVTKSFTAHKFRNKVALTIILFFKIFKIWYRFQKLNKKIREIL